MGLDGQLIGTDSEEFSDLEANIVEELNSRFGGSLKIGSLHGENFFERIGRYSDMQLLRSYAAFLSTHGSPPNELPSLPINEELRSMYDGTRPFSHPHLMDHSDSEGYYAPSAFLSPLKFGIPIATDAETASDKEDLWIDVGSSVSLIDELDSINRHLGVSINFDIADSHKPKLEIAEGDIWGGAKWAWSVLYWLAAESIDQQLLVMFC